MLPPEPVREMCRLWKSGEFWILEEQDLEGAESSGEREVQALVGAESSGEREVQALGGAESSGERFDTNLVVVLRKVMNYFMRKQIQID